MRKTTGVKTAIGAAFATALVAGSISAAHAVAPTDETTPTTVVNKNGHEVNEHAAKGQARAAEARAQHETTATDDDADTDVTEGTEGSEGTDEESTPATPVVPNEHAGDHPNANATEHGGDHPAAPVVPNEHAGDHPNANATEHGGEHPVVPDEHAGDHPGDHATTHGG